MLALHADGDLLPEGHTLLAIATPCTSLAVVRAGGAGSVQPTRSRCQIFVTFI